MKMIGVKKYFLVTVMIVSICITAHAQSVYFTKNGKISFFSKTPLEDIDAKNNDVASKINSKTGDMEFQLLVKGFHFKKASMQDHFNEPDYMDSDKYPKAVFKGKIKNISVITFSKNGVYNITVEGDLTIHGVTQKINCSGTVTVNGEKLNAKTIFTIKLKDYKVSVPSIVTKRVAETIQVTVDCDYQLYKG